MNSPTATLTSDTEILDCLEQESTVEGPTLPLKIFTKEVFDEKVLLLRMEYEAQKPTGIFF